MELDELRRAEAVDINLNLGDSTYLGFGPITDMTGECWITGVKQTTINPGKMSVN